MSLAKGLRHDVAEHIERYLWFHIGKHLVHTIYQEKSNRLGAFYHRDPDALFCARG